MNKVSVIICTYNRSEILKEAIIKRDKIMLEDGKIV